MYLSSGSSLLSDGSKSDSSEVVAWEPTADDVCTPDPGEFSNNDSQFDLHLPIGRLDNPNLGSSKEVSPRWKWTRFLAGKKSPSQHTKAVNIARADFPFSDLQEFNPHAMQDQQSIELSPLGCPTFSYFNRPVSKPLETPEDIQCAGGLELDSVASPLYSVIASDHTPDSRMSQSSNTGTRRSAWGDSTLKPHGLGLSKKGSGQRQGGAMETGNRSNGQLTPGQQTPQTSDNNAEESKLESTPGPLGPENPRDLRQNFSMESQQYMDELSPASKQSLASRRRWRFFKGRAGEKSSPKSYGESPDGRARGSTALLQSDSMLSGRGGSLMSPSRTPRPSESPKQGRLGFRRNLSPSNKQQIDLEKLAPLFNAEEALPAMEMGRKVRMAMRQKQLAAVVNASIKLERSMFDPSIGKMGPMLVLEDTKSAAKRALILDATRDVSTDKSAAEFLRGAECRPDSAALIERLLADQPDSTHADSQLHFTMLPVKNASNGSLIFLWNDSKEVNEFIAVLALLKAHSQNGTLQLSV